MAKNLTDLTERTATAETDLMHVNSGGTDYKETKANFLIDLPRRFYPNTSSDLRAQIKAKVDEIGTTVSLYGIIGSYNHQTETGTPINNNFYFEALSSGTTNVKLVITIIGATGRKWESYYANGAWGEWQEVPWLGSFSKQWANDVAITTQVDTIGSSIGTYFGYASVGSSSVQTTLGLPLATSGLIEARPYNDNYKRIIYTPNGSTRKFVKIKSAGTWQTEWIEEPTRSEIDSIFKRIVLFNFNLASGGTAKHSLADHVPYGNQSGVVFLQPRGFTLNNISKIYMFRFNQAKTSCYFTDVTSGVTSSLAARLDSSGNFYNTSTENGVTYDCALFLLYY